MPNLTRRQVLKATGAASLGLIAPGEPSGRPIRWTGAAPDDQRGARAETSRVTGAATGRHAPDAENHERAPRQPRRRPGIIQSVARWCFEDIPLRPNSVQRVAEMGLDRHGPPAQWRNGPIAHDHGLVVSCGDVGAGTIEDGLERAPQPCGRSSARSSSTSPGPRAKGVPNVDLLLRQPPRHGRTPPPSTTRSAVSEECAPIAEAEGVTILVEALNSKPGGHRGLHRRPTCPTPSKSFGPSTRPACASSTTSTTCRSWRGTSSAP